MKAEPAGEPPCRLVIDTNVWISAALSREGAPAGVVRQVLARGLPVVLSPATFAELETRLWLPKFDRYLSMELRRRILHDLNGAALWVDIPPELAAQTWCRDGDDDKFIHAALAARAGLLVTGDRDLLELSAIPSVRIVSPAEALRAPELSP